MYQDTGPVQMFDCIKLLDGDLEGGLIGIIIVKILRIDWMVGRNRQRKELIIMF